MKTVTKKIIIVLLFTMGIVACNKDDAVLENPLAEVPVAENPKSENSITGAVVLPAGSAVDVKGLTIASPIGQVAVSDGTYEMNTIKDSFLTQMVTDTNGEVLLMGYTYPGQTDFEINATSTVLAILMNMPTSLVSAREAKIELITLFLNDSNFIEVVKDFEKTLVEGINPFDKSNTSFAQNIELYYRQLLFPQANKSGKLDYSYDPVDVRVTNNEITFVNLGKTYETVIGIYKDDVKIENINLERVTFIPTTVGDAISAFASAYGGTELSSGLQPVEYTYTFENDGQYDIKIRTSKLADEAIENDIALLNNIINWGTDLILEILPLGDCVQPIIADFKQHAQTFGSFPDATTEQEKLGLLYDVLYTFFNQTKTLITCIGSAEEFEDYLKKFGTILKFIDLVGKIGNGGNIMLGITQLVADEGKMDLCYAVEGSIASECSEVDVYVAGYNVIGNKSVAMVWKNGVATALTDGSSNSVANSVFVYETDVYISGNVNSVATLWKNGIATTLDEGVTKSVYVASEDVYVAGNKAGTGIATVWKNGLAYNLTSSYSSANSIFVSGNDVYVAGSTTTENGRSRPTVWKNSIAMTLTDEPYSTEVNSVFVSDDDVFAVGFGSSETNFVAKIWKNGVSSDLTDGSTQAMASSVYIMGNEIYVSGYEGNKANENNFGIATVWKNGVPTALTNGSSNAWARSVFISGNDVYVAGHDGEYNSRVVKVWKNGVATALTDGNSHADATSIFVKEKNMKN